MPLSKFDLWKGLKIEVVCGGILLPLHNDPDVVHTYQGSNRNKRSSYIEVIKDSPIEFRRTLDPDFILTHGLPHGQVWMAITLNGKGETGQAITNAAIKTQWRRKGKYEQSCTQNCPIVRFADNGPRVFFILETSQ